MHTIPLITAIKYATADTWLSEVRVTSDVTVIALMLAAIPSKTVVAVSKTK